jgi:hypothetical protein
VQQDLKDVDTQRMKLRYDWEERLELLEALEELKEYLEHQMVIGHANRRFDDPELIWYLLQVEQKIATAEHDFLEVEAYLKDIEEDIDWVSRRRREAAEDELLAEWVSEQELREFQDVITRATNLRFEDWSVDSEDSLPTAGFVFGTSQHFSFTFTVPNEVEGMKHSPLAPTFIFEEVPFNPHFNFAVPSMKTSSLGPQNLQSPTVDPKVLGHIESSSPAAPSHGLGLVFAVPNYRQFEEDVSPLSQGSEIPGLLGTGLVGDVSPLSRGEIGAQTFDYGDEPMDLDSD